MLHWHDIKNKINNDIKDTDEYLYGKSLKQYLVIRSSPGEQRDTVLLAYIENDIFQCNAKHSARGTPYDKRHMLRLFESYDVVVKQYAARLYNALASLQKGLCWKITHFVWPTTSTVILKTLLLENVMWFVTTSRESVPLRRSGWNRDPAEVSVERSRHG